MFLYCLSDRVTYSQWQTMHYREAVICLTLLRLHELVQTQCHMRYTVSKPHSKLHCDEQGWKMSLNFMKKSHENF